jgi:hypothetical protein
MNVTRKLTTAAVTGALFLNMVAPAFAGSTITITNSSNGRDSENKAKVELNREIVVTQSNNTSVSNEVNQDANTGDNKIKDNIGGDIELTTGNVTQDANVSTQAGFNSAQVNDCGCDYEVEIINEKNGRDSENTAKFEAGDTKTLFQENNTYVKNDVDQDANTGDNDVKDNIDGDVSVKTGSVDQDAEVATLAGANHGDLGGDGDGESSFSLTNSMNGRDSENEIKVELLRGLLATQANNAEVKTYLDQDGDTGDNEVKDNIGGVDVETGDIDQAAIIAAWLGANALEVDDCCEIDADLTNEKNGRDAESELKLELGGDVLLFQDNDQEAKNDADQDGDTGDNEVADNLSDDMHTGDVDSDVEIETKAGHNVIGDADFDFDFDLDLDEEQLSLLMLLVNALL